MRDSADQRIEFRVGIHLGDVVVESDGDLMGDGVNIAARLEGIAEPGGDLPVRTRLTASARQTRPRGSSIWAQDRVKNIAEPVRAYACRSRPAQTTPGRSASLTHQRPAALLALPDKPSIAVLPFQNMSGDPEQEYFADGMVEDIITACRESSGCS